MNKIDFTRLHIFSFLILGLLIGCQSPQPTGPTPPDPIPGKFPKQDRIDLAMQMEFELTKDPATNTVPRERLYDAWAETQRRISGLSTRTGTSSIIWEERGPSNVGGRTRGIIVDANDPTNNTVWAGGVSGGLFKTTNISASDPAWRPIDDLFDNLAVSCMAQDPSNPNIMYFGTGEGWFNADALRGLGIWKTTDGGQTWSRLPSTANATFYYTQKIVITSTGVVFASTSNGGLLRSTDRGDTWTTVLGLGTFANSSEATDIELASDGTLYVGMGIFSQGSLWRSTDNGDNWTQLTNGLPGVGYERVEIASAPSDPNRVYVLLQDGSNNQCEGIYRSNNGGDSFTSVNNPSAIGMSSFTRNQAWYDLICAVDPNNPDILMIGGVDLLRSTNGGNSWTQVSQWFGGGGLQYVHADQHEIFYVNSNLVFFGNDGGVWRSTNGGLSILEKNGGYNVTQFYSCAIHPDKGENYFLGGTQDNGTHRVTTTGFGPSQRVSGGDGSFAHIDTDEPNIQMSGFTYQNYVITTNSWQSSSGAGDGSQSGAFINPTDYDSDANILYCAHDGGTFYRISGIGGGRTENQLTVAAFGGGTVRHISVSQNVANRVYFGTSNGRVIRVDNAHTNNPTGVRLNTSGGPRGSISCVAIEEGNDNHLLVTSSNYGIISVWETYDAGGTWFNREGNLPDMPVRWAIFNPTNNNSALLATELGVWSTDDLNETTVQWFPNVTMPNTRVSMLQVRESGTILAGTYGRGFYTTSGLEVPNIEFGVTQKVVFESSESGTIDDCNGFTEIRIPVAISSPPTVPVPVLINFGPSTTIEPEDYKFVPSNLLLFPPGVADTQYLTIHLANDGLLEGNEFMELLLDLPAQGSATVGENNQSFLIFKDAIDEFDLVATDLNDADSHQVPPNKTIYFHTAEERLLAKFENLSGHDFGCVSIEIDRAGTSTQEFIDGYSDRNQIADKTLFISAENPSDTATYRLTLYLTGEEAAGWASATGLSALNDLQVISSSVSLPQFSPETSAPGDFSLIETNTVEGSGNFLLTATFSGTVFGGLGFGAPGQDLDITNGNDLVFQGEPLTTSNRLFWDLSGSYEWSFFDVFEVEEDGTLTYLTTVNAEPGVSSYEAFDQDPIEGINRYQLYLQTEEGNFAWSNIVEIEWEDVPEQQFPVAPNPFTDAISILPGDENVAYEVSLYNLSGQLVAAESFVSDRIFTWDLLPYSITGGVYFLILEGEGKERQVYKLMKR